MSEMQAVIRHNPWYLPAYDTLRQMMHTKNLVLEINDDCSLVEAFNSLDADFSLKWDASSVEEKRALIKAIINYPYIND
jgi:hypothetical protein